MNISTRLLKQLSHLPNWKHLCNIIREEITVQTFCDIQVNVPYNVKIQPLDVHKYHNSDLLRIELQGVQGGRQTVKHIQDGNNIKIFACMEEYEQDTTCFIQAPVKANLSVNSHGNISAGVFGGSKLVLKSTKGSIFVNKFNGETIDLKTENGDVVLKGAVVASNIDIVIANTGSIKAKRLQGLNSNLKTDVGNIVVDASYCDNGTFDVNQGDLMLQNIHKNSKILLKGGNLNLTGLDGQLTAELENSEADIQISRVLGDSEIVICGEGALKLRLSDECQENTMFEITCKKHTLEPGITLIPSRGDNKLYLMPKTENYKTVKVTCEKGQVDVHSASWFDMLKVAKKD